MTSIGCDAVATSRSGEWRSPRRSATVTSAGSRPGERRLDLAAVLAQLGLDERQAEERVGLGLGRERPQLGGVAGQRLAVLADPQEALLGQAPAPVAGHARGAGRCAPSSPVKWMR